MLHVGMGTVTVRVVPRAGRAVVRGGPHGRGPAGSPRWDLSRVVVGHARGCYRPSAMAGKTAYTKKELEDLRKRLTDERAELEVQLTTIEETSFATAQSDMSGEVSFDEENADAGTFSGERESELSIENNVRDLMGKIHPALTA